VLEVGGEEVTTMTIGGISSGDIDQVPGTLRPVESISIYLVCSVFIGC
jgi:hypothetical protein